MFWFVLVRHAPAGVVHDNIMLFDAQLLAFLGADSVRLYASPPLMCLFCACYVPLLCTSTLLCLLCASSMHLYTSVPLQCLFYAPLCFCAASVHLYAFVPLLCHFGAPLQVRLPIWTTHYISESCLQHWLSTTLATALSTTQVSAQYPIPCNLKLTTLPPSPSPLFFSVAESAPKLEDFSIISPLNRNGHPISWFGQPLKKSLHGIDAHF